MSHLWVLLETDVFEYGSEGDSGSQMQIFIKEFYSSSKYLLL